MLVCIVHSWNYDTNSRQAVAHFMITDDLKKTNMQVNKFKEDLVKYYDDLLFAWVQRHLSLLSVFSDNCGYQFKSRSSSFALLNTTRCVEKSVHSHHFHALALRHQLAWMGDFVESNTHQLRAIIHNFSAAQHGKGAADFEAGLLLRLTLLIQFTNVNFMDTFSPFQKSGQAKTKASTAATHGLQIDNAQQLHAFLEANHSEVTSEQHERLHEVT